MVDELQVGYKAEEKHSGRKICHAGVARRRQSFGIMRKTLVAMTLTGCHLLHGPQLNGPWSVDVSPSSHNVITFLLSPSWTSYVSPAPVDTESKHIHTYTANVNTRYTQSVHLDAFFYFKKFYF